VLTPSELCLVAAELNGTCAGAKVRKVGQPTDTAIVLRLSREGDDRGLLLSASRRFPRAHLVATPPPNPRTPPPFCVELRARLEGSRLVSVETLPRDRVLVATFDARDDSGAPRRLHLRGHFFGSKPDLLLVDADHTVIASILGAESRFSRGTKVPSGPPPARDPGSDVPFSGFGEDFSPRSFENGDLSAALEAWFAPRESDAESAELRAECAKDLRESRKKQEKILEGLAKDLAALDAIPTLRREGELLKSVVHSIKRGQKSIKVTDWETGAPVEIALDPSKTPREEVSARFDEMHRLERSGEAVAARRGIVEERIAAIDAAARTLEAAVDADAIAEWRRVAEERGILRKKPAPPPPESSKRKETPEPRKPHHVFLSKDGLEILVGRTASDNDVLTFKVAAGNDWWLHVRDYPGSHVVIRDTGADIPEQTLLDAAALAVHFSKADAASKHDVSWTRRKFVSKSKGAPAGQVLLSTHKTLRLRPEPERLARLLNHDIPKR